VTNVLSTDVARGVQRAILRLVKTGPEREAIESGQIDAVVDPVSGTALLLPEAQKVLIERMGGLLGRFGLSFDWYWEQDEEFRFMPNPTHGSEDLAFADPTIVGRTLWELSVNNLSESEWRSHRQQLAWHAEFRDFEIRRATPDGRVIYLAISGAPILDESHQFKGYRGIARDITARRQNEIATQLSSRFARATLEALSTPVGVLDGSGILLDANAAWHQFAAAHSGAGTNVGQGTSYLDELDDTSGPERIDATVIAAGIRQVLAGQREVFRYEQTCTAASGSFSLRWNLLCVTRVLDDVAARAVLTRQDITDRVRAQQLLGLENAVAGCLLRSQDANAGLKMVIRTICESQGWYCGRYFQFDPVSETLRFTEAWGEADAATELFLQQSGGLIFRGGAGLAGRVSQTGQPYWAFKDARGTVVSPMALPPETGQEGAFVFPVTSCEELVGVLAFSGQSIHEPDDRLLHTARSIGRDIGSYLRREVVLSTLRQSEERYRRLTMVASDWHWEQDSEFRFTLCIGSGPLVADSVLGNAIWDLPGVVPAGGNWSTHISQLKAQWSFRDFHFTLVLEDGGQAHYCISGEPIYNEAGGFAGYRGTGLEIIERKGEEALRHGVDGGSRGVRESSDE
jgi:PAS domain-containing protein